MSRPYDGSVLEMRSMKPTQAVRNIIIATLVVYLLQLLPGLREWTYTWGVLAPARVFLLGEVWRLVTYMFLHSPFNPFHVAFNMLALWMFGVELEQRWGARKFTIFYVLCGAGAGLFSTIAWDSRILGASGAVLALLTAYAFYYPRQQILMFFVLPLPVWLAVAIIGVISLVSARIDSGIAHLTHLGGILVALAYLGLPPLTRQVRAGLAHQVAQERATRAAEQTASREQFFAESIDPILKKISDSGMESLTAAEKKLLQRASQQHGDRLKRERIVPFDIK